MQPIKKIAATIILSCTAFLTQAQDTSKPSPAHSVLDADTMLVVCIGLLAIVIISLANTLLFTMKYYKSKKQQPLNNNLKAMMLVACILVGFSAMAETPNLVSNTVVNETGTSAFRMILYIIVGLEMIVIFLFTRLIKFFMRGEYAHEAVPARKPLIHIDYKKIWSKLNRFKPLEEEASIDTGHSYDGIHELNNVTPPWFKVAFILSIFFAFGYMYRYQIAKTGPSQEEEYKTEMAEAQVQHEAYLKSQKSNVDENTVVMLDAAGIAAGAELFKSNCIACHGNKGQGGVGPNLTDEYWLHNGGIKDVFKSIKYGWKEKGMQAWQSNFSPEEIAQLASFVKSLKGSKPVGAKDPQGELYVETKDSAAAKTPVDSASKK